MIEAAARMNSTGGADLSNDLDLRVMLERRADVIPEIAARTKMCSKVSHSAALLVVVIRFPGSVCPY